MSGVLDLILMTMTILLIIGITIYFIRRTHNMNDHDIDRESKIYEYKFKRYVRKEVERDKENEESTEKRDANEEDK